MIEQDNMELFSSPCGDAQNQVVVNSYSFYLVSNLTCSYCICGFNKPSDLIIFLRYDLFFRNYNGKITMTWCLYRRYHDVSASLPACLGFLKSGHGTGCWLRDLLLCVVYCEAGACGRNHGDYVWRVSHAGHTPALVGFLSACLSQEKKEQLFSTGWHEPQPWDTKAALLWVAVGNEFVPWTLPPELQLERCSNRWNRRTTLIFANEWYPRKSSCSWGSGSVLQCLS